MESLNIRAGFRGLVYTLILTATMVCSIKPAGWAMLIPQEMPSGTSTLNRSADMKTIRGALESKMLRERLKDFGLSETEINSRLSRLSDKQIHQLAMQIHTVNPGGDFTVVGILIVVVLVLFIIYLVKRV